jgi:hypothetical protein
MSLDQIEAALTTLAKTRELSTLLVDIERLPGSFTADFWDLNAFKNRRIHADLVTEWPSTLCFASLWYGPKPEGLPRREFHATWDGGADAMHEAAFRLYDAADIVVTYNGVGFDNKHFASGWIERGLGRPSRWVDVDLLKVARGAFGWESKTLDSVCKRLGLEPKNDKYEVDVARAAAAGDPAAQRRIKRYNVNDVDIMVPVYERLLPHIKSHPHVAPSVGLEKPTCPRCGSTDVKRTGTYSPGVYNYLSYKCNACTGPFRTEYQSRGPSVRAL